uniref:Uncharacterized protein n=1 Tax=Candidatus Kentrum sp. FM TaxID=2126340 RepID=A0A450VMX0_9GAMM|nr:MAG: hypothetical protein BECKFM1743A_GA0114220_100124 [Candidatus Kentron sp. FM]VFJ44243.1 MAG: hypothetical protein BECKFM1743C_GA0114222_100097 [Candidatus Kentron sp. FM]VFK06158.1 MAG: hypothetical protein BECKFM1743B_GA0114221_1001113 [Candidatus Kentron sp. FM]
MGSAGYLFTLVLFVLLGDSNRPADPSLRIGTALAMGLAVAFMAYALGERTAISGATDTAIPAITTGAIDNGDPLGSIRLLATVLGVALGVVTLIAHRNVEYARDAAEKAKAETEKARAEVQVVGTEARLLEQTNRLLERIQAVRYASEDLRREASEREKQDRSLANILKGSASGLDGMARFFLSLHQWVLEPRLTPPDDLVEKAGLIEPILQKLGRLTDSTALGAGARERKQRLRIDYWQPASRLLESLLETIQSPHFLKQLPDSGSENSGLQEVSRVLRKVRAELDRL